VLGRKCSGIIPETGLPRAGQVCLRVSLDLPRAGQACPRVSLDLPRAGQACLRVSLDLPRAGQACLRVRMDLPSLGKLVRRVRMDLPSLGKLVAALYVTCPAWASLPQHGIGLARVGQACIYTGSGGCIKSNWFPSCRQEGWREATGWSDQIAIHSYNI
jgi:hypothetical protein